MSDAMHPLLAATPLLDVHHPDIEALVARRGWRTLSLRSAEERIRHLLLSEGRGLRCELEITGSLKDLARRLGLTHESLYRTLARMQKDGVIAREGLRLRLAKDDHPGRMT